MAVVEEFVMAAHDKWPNCLIQFEDFQTDKAFAILERFRDKCLCFNDDIQGTGAVVAAGCARAVNY
jgi:malic enzyme